MFNISFIDEARDAIKDSYKNTMFVAFAYNLVFMVLILLFCNVSFETNDDKGMANIMYGATGDYDAHLVFINVFVGAILKGLIQIFPTVPWYPILMYVLMFVAFTIITYILLKKNFFWGTLFSSGILIFYGYNFYTLLQFTKVSGIATFAGILLLFFALEENKLNWKPIVLAMIMLLFGVSYRFNMFCMIFIIMSGYGVYFVIRNLRMREYQKIIKCVVVFVSAILLCFSLRILNSAIYAGNEEWSAYRTFNTNRALLLDYGFPTYEENVELYAALNITEDDLALYKSWDFADPDKFNIDTVKTLVQEKVNPDITIEYIKSFFVWFPLSMLKYKWISAYFIIIIASLIINKKNILWIAYELIMLCALQFYFFFNGRYLMNRVDICLFVGLTTLLAVVILDRVPAVDDKMKRKVCIASVLSLCALSLPLWYEKNVESDDKEKQTQAYETCQLINNDKEHLYFSSVSCSTMWNNGYGVWDVIPKGAKSNYYGLGGWGTYAPFSESVKEAYGIQNPFADIVDNESIYLIANGRIEQIVNYIQRNYSPSATYIIRKDINGYVFYNVVSKPSSIDASKLKDVPNDFDSKFNISYNGNVVAADGHAFTKGESSYAGRCYLQVKNVDGSIGVYDFIQYENENYSGDENGQFSKYKGAWMVGTVLEISIFYEIGENIYCIETQTF